MKRDTNAFAAVAKTGRKMGFAWMPNVNTEPKYPDPWRPGKLTYLDLRKKLKDVIADAVVYHCRLYIARNKTMSRMSEDDLKDWYYDLQALTYQRVMKGLKSWCPSYGINIFVQNHVRFTALTLVTKYKTQKETSPVLVRSETLSSADISFMESMAIAESYIDGDREDDAAKLYAAICAETLQEESDQ